MKLKFLLLITGLILSTSLWAQKGQKVKISTVFGDMTVLLYDDTPIHRDNFISNINSGSYNNALFHRVISGFMAQGGDFNSVGAGPTQPLGSDNCIKLPNEIRRNHFHKKGALAAARLPDNYNPDRQSSGCQFFIVQGYKFTDQQLNKLENDNYKFPDFNRAFYKVKGGYPALDFQYTVFGEVIDGIDVLDLICAVPTGKHVKDRPNSDIKMKITLIE